MEDEGAGSDDGRPPTRPAPAESPARETFRPASKKAKGKKKKSNELDEGELEEFIVIVSSARDETEGRDRAPTTPAAGRFI